MNTEIDVQGIRRDGQQMVLTARDVAAGIKDDASYSIAVTFLRGIKSYRDRVRDKFGPATEKAYAAWKEITALRKKADAPADEAERIVKPAMATYAQEAERKQALARQEALAAQRKAEDSARLAAAESAEKAGDKQSAEAILCAPPAPVVVAPVGAPKADGVSYREIWKAEVLDLGALVRAVAIGTAPISLLQANEKVLGQQARSLKSEFRIPGVRVWSEKSVAVRSTDGGA